ncbi:MULTISPECIES: GNAT family N-acetyltransferase [Streptomyces]|uniref:GNAT family N-acetyltransferase n=1 Tax=Streptomyces TaxID=1883 RepID=UPI00163BEDB5|nr:MULTISPECIES: GNAT family N-acetyltransferase [Streptomyces]MBC2876931.1 GNAT family N-acetyltransferase [Streptomyces sp. TYQ1024]UBI35957.1 GNAT family N-acetyltransferase [Streptomyces mobaraensis]UKW28550.1 GNAT family N-acetyltransferase [Streptomyces sp. TYQ1024]
MTITLRTPRLTLRRWREDDLEPMAAINGDPDVMRWIRDGSVQDRAQTAASIAAWEREWEEHGIGLFAAELREERRLAGFIGLSVPHYLPEILPAVEIGWRLGRPFWGRGLATEGARAVLDFALRDRGLARIVSVHAVGNDASERVMRKLGMRFDRETRHPLSGAPVRVHVLEAKP